MGDMADVDFGDMLDYLAADPATTSVLLYMEGVTHARKFMSAARACARLKPVVVIKAGRHLEGAKAAASHTGAMAGSDAVYDAAFRRAGLLRVGTMEELFQAVETLAMASPVRGGRLAILTNGGGPGVLATDALIDAGGKLAALSPDTVEALDACLPATWSHGNPVDIIGDARGDRYAAALQPLLRDKEVDATLVMNCPTALAPGLDTAREVIAARGTGPRAPMLTCWLGDGTASPARALFSASRIPTYDTPEGAVRGFMHLVRYRANQDLLLETPPSLPEAFTPDVEGARAVLRQAFADARSWVPPLGVNQLLSYYGIPVVDMRGANTPREAAHAAAEIGWPVALKIASRDITHKSDVGGVALGLADAEAVEHAAEQMLRRVRSATPDARLEGFTVEPMLQRRGAHELIVGTTEDRQFGPVILFGHGGTAVEVLADKALALPPLNMTLAREAIERTRVAKLLHGYRDRPAAALEAIALTLVKVAQMVADLPELAELDINPLLADENGVIALDARVKIRPAATTGATRLAIRPYPTELEQRLTLLDGTEVQARPVRPEDGPAVVELFRRMEPADIRLRFFSAMRTVPAAVAARLSQIDYDREMALVAVAPDRELLAIVHLICDPDGERGEFAAMVRSDLKGRGLGYGLMRGLIEYAQRRGVRTIFGDVLAENIAMLRLCNELRFELVPHPEDPTCIRAVLDLAARSGTSTRPSVAEKAALRTY
jgi:acetyltransferase